MSEVKTKATKQSATDFLQTIEPKEKRDDCLALLKIFQKATGEKAVMWGSSIVGFGMYSVRSGNKENVWPLIAFSPRKQNLTLYVAASNKENTDLLEKLGKHKVSGGCLHIHKLSDVDEIILASLIKKSFQLQKKTHG